LARFRATNCATSALSNPELRLGLEGLNLAYGRGMWQRKANL
jgi:hypothetical protein